MRALFHLNKYFIKYKWRLILGLIFVITSNLFAIFPAQIIRVAFNVVADTVTRYQMLHNFNEKTTYYSFMAGTIVMFGLVVFGLSLFKGFFSFLTRQTIIVMSRWVEYDLKNDIFAHYQRLDNAFYKVNSTGDLMNRISEDVSKVRMYIGPAIMYSTNMIVLFTLVISAMFSVNVKLSLYILIPLPLLSISIYYVSNVINIKSEQVQRQLSTISTFVQEAFSGIRVFKAYHLEEQRLSYFENEVNQYKRVNLDLVKVNALFMPLMVLLIGLSNIITIYIGGKLAIAGEISTGNIAEFVIYVNMLTWPVAVVGWVTSMVQRAAASQKRINEFLDHRPQITNTISAPLRVKGNISFKNVSFTYPESGTQALKNISFDVTAGQSIAITGRTGSGKTTVAQLISRMYDVSGGQVLIDGSPITRLNLNDLRKNMGVANQEVFLFSDTIGNNIAFGGEKNTSLEEIIKAAKIADIHENITNLPEGYNTVVGERGVTLSGGQKQRIAIARALLTDPKILILDDSLSAVDTETEDNILNGLKTFMKGRTTIIISHRISSVRNCDQIFVLDDGHLKEQGTHDQLIANQALYNSLNEQQQLTSVNN